MTQLRKIAVITGANRGLGLETCRQLAQAGMTVILTSRDSQRGQAAADELAAQGLDVTFRPVDVADERSIGQLAEFIANTYRRLDVLVNNAGVFLDPMVDGDPSASSVLRASVDTLRASMDTNLYGPWRMCCALIPLMQGEGRVVNVSSGMGQLAEMNGGCPGYRFSKTALNALTRSLADELKGTLVKVNSICPGWVRTDMGGPQAPRTVQEGADTIVWAATLPDDGPSGGFFRDRAPIPW